MKIVADDKIPFLRGVFEPFAQVQYLPGQDINKEALQEADALIVRTRTACNKDLLEGTPVSAIATATIGTDHLDIPWIESQGIRWANAPGCNSGSVKQYLASVLALLTLSGFELRGKNMGIIGVGNTGSKVKEVAEAFGMRVLLNDPPRAESEPDFENTDFSELLEQADVLSFHVPLKYREPHPTLHMMNSGTFGKLKRGAILINASRGEVIAQEALFQSLEIGWVKTAILDVWENEPNIWDALHRKVLIGTPHIAGYSLDGKANGTSTAVNFIAQCFSLPLTGWFPGELPGPKENKIKLDTNDLNLNLLLSRAVLQTYDAMEDHIRMKTNPANFEKLRGNYPARREFQYFEVEVDGARLNIKDSLAKLGFMVS